MEPLRVLVIDDDWEVLEALSDMLSFIGHRVTAVRTVLEGKYALAWREPQVVVTDLNLAGELSIELLEHARDRHPEIGRVLLTGSFPHDRSVIIARSLVHVALSKPVSASELRQAIELARAHASEDAKH